MEILFRNIWFRTFIPLLLMGTISVFTNCLVVEITVNNEIVWHVLPYKLSFYIILISTTLLAFYQTAVSKDDRNLIKGFTPKQYEASIRNKVAEVVAKRSKKLIQDGKIDQLEKETETFKKLYGENK